MSRLLLLIGLVSSLLTVARADPDFAVTRVADGFDFPVGGPNGEGFYKSRGFTVTGHLGEDWVSQEGPGAALGNPVHATADGVVTLARDFMRAWGNAVVIRHAYQEDGTTKFIDSLYGHLDRILVAEGQPVSRGQQIGTVGNAHGLYPPHLHFEIHKNLSIGVVHTVFARDMNNYQDPTTFLNTHRACKKCGDILTVAINTYTMPTFAGIRPKAFFSESYASALVRVDQHKHLPLFVLSRE